MGKALGFLGSLVGFPVLAVLVAPIHGLIRMLTWVVAHGGYLIGFPLFAPTVGRIWNDRKKSDGTPIAMAVVYLFLTTVITAMICKESSDFWENYRDIILGVGATNAFSVLYELGRLYYKKVISKERSVAEAPVLATTTATSTGTEFCKLLDEVLDQFECTKEQAEEFRKQLRVLEEGGKVSVNAATMLRKEISARETDVPEALELPTGIEESSGF